jgi:hypothetical protein
VKRAVFAAVAGLAAALVVVPSAAAIDDVNTQRLRNGVTAAGILEHMRGFQPARGQRQRRQPRRDHAGL